ncbi:maintenance of mitochondrial morphology protein 1 [Lactarius sanguifluus]|nr:maintenance of mitochondrial morphology protein 1 [Lactarius sanguifluus]
MRSFGDMFTFQPTFTQGLVLGQFSILALLAVILKYLFLDTERSQKVPVYADPAPPALQPSLHSAHVGENSARVESEPTEWLNVLLHQIAGVYRSKLRDDLQGIDGDEIVRQRVEDFVNRMRPSGILDRTQVHSVHLGVSAPQLSNARSIPVAGPGPFERNEFDMVYKDDLSISLSTAYLFNYPTFGFARLPVSLTISLSVFSCRAVITPPSPSSLAPALNFTVLPNFTLELQSRSLLGSRAKLADVPKLHELIDSQIRRAIGRWGTLRIPLPGLSHLEAQA